MAQDNSVAVQRWIRDVSNRGLTMRDGVPYGYAGSTVRVNEQGQLMYYRRPRPDRGDPAWGPVVLATWAPRSRTFVLNGDGFTDNSATNWQNNLRGWVLNDILPTNPRTGAINRRMWGIADGARYVIIPYAALAGAGIDPLTVDPIHVEADRFENVWHAVPKPPALSAFRYEDPNFDPTDTRTFNQRANLGVERRGFRYRTVDRRVQVWTHRATGEKRTSYPPWGTESEYDSVHERMNMGTYSVHMAGTREPAGWHTISPRTGGSRDWGWSEQVHHLGASVFWAVDESGRRHRFVSAFDQDEPRPMYYLAQLPNRGRIRTYEEAIAALAPPLVHQAREQGVAVYRQGDVFAIETNHTDEWIYERARTRVRREVVTYDPVANPLTPPELDDLDHVERTPCLHCGSVTRSGWGPRSRRCLMIYGTSHTADEVVVISGGAVYVRGTLWHDPYLEEPGRRPEHVTINLGDGSKWHLAVRNTVPRRRGVTGDSNQPEEVAAA